MDKFIIILILFIIIIIYILSNNTESFGNTNNYFKQYCPSCQWRTAYSCGQCTNCGQCVNSTTGISECVPGNSSGPYYRNDCDYWQYGAPYDYYPNSDVYPIIKTRANYPHDYFNYPDNLEGNTSRYLPTQNIAKYNEIKSS
jgi:hypothetical protein